MSEWIELQGWDGPWEDDDKDANLKSDVAFSSAVDPLQTTLTRSGPMRFG